MASARPGSRETPQAPSKPAAAVSAASRPSGCRPRTRERRRSPGRRLRGAPRTSPRPGRARSRAAPAARHPPAGRGRWRGRRGRRRPAGGPADRARRRSRPPRRQQPHPGLAERHGGQAVGQEGGVVGRHGAGVASGDLDLQRLVAGDPGLRAAAAGAPGRRRAGRRRRRRRRDGEVGGLHAGAEAARVAGDRPARRRGRGSWPPGSAARGAGCPRRPGGPAPLRRASSRAGGREAVAHLRERLRRQGDLAGQHAAGGGAPLLDGAVHPFEGPAALVLQRPEGVHGGGVVARLGETRGPTAAAARRPPPAAGCAPAAVTASAKAPVRRAIRRPRSPVAGEEPLPDHQPRGRGRAPRPSRRPAGGGRGVPGRRPPPRGRAAPRRAGRRPPRSRPCDSRRWKASR